MTRPSTTFSTISFRAGPEGQPEGEGDFRQQSLGSGVILDKNGYILTNDHVITQRFAKTG